MPIEIRELNIKTFVNETPPAQTAAGGGGGRLSPEDQDRIVAACVEEVLRALKDKEER